eukprot:7472-Heterococcus_DN1.PRE.1
MIAVAAVVAAVAVAVVVTVMTCNNINCHAGTLSAVDRKQKSSIFCVEVFSTMRASLVVMCSSVTVTSAAISISSHSSTGRR